jgi:CHASE2 domain-containing sensor protein
MADVARPTGWGAIRNAGLNHWLLVGVLTLLGLLLADAPLLPRFRDRAYLWLQHAVRGAQRRVIVVAIDDADFWHGPFGHTRPVKRELLADIVTRVASANPDVIGLDVGLETPAPVSMIEDTPLLQPTLALLSAVDAAGRHCPVILPKTISGDGPPYRGEHDVYDLCGFDPAADVTLGHTSMPIDLRQIPTRVRTEASGMLDSFALAVVRASTHDDLPSAYADEQHDWPYSFFLPLGTFVPKAAPVGTAGVLTSGMVRTATAKELRQWLRGEIVLIGGAWHESPHGGAYVDAHPTPVGALPGVLLHANYVQSMLWGAMFPIPEGWRIAVEILLSIGIAMIFLLARGWRRVGLVVLSVASVIVATWVFSAAIGIFFDLVLPVTFLGVHVIVEEFGERLTIIETFRHEVTSFLIFAMAALGVTVVVRAWHRQQHELVAEQRLQVSSLAPGDIGDRVFAALNGKDETGSLFLRLRRDKESRDAGLVLLRLRTEALRGALVAQLARLAAARTTGSDDPLANARYLRDRAQYDEIKASYERVHAEFARALMTQENVDRQRSAITP